MDTVRVAVCRYLKKSSDYFNLVHKTEILHGVDTEGHPHDLDSITDRISIVVHEPDLTRPGDDDEDEDVDHKYCVTFRGEVIWEGTTNWPDEETIFWDMGGDHPYFAWQENDVSNDNFTFWIKAPTSSLRTTRATF